MRISDWSSDVCSSDLSTYSSFDRSRSVSSIRSRNRPPCFLAHSQLWSAVRTLPTCRVPVGEGAKRVTTVIARAYSRFGHAVTTNCSRGDAETRRGMRSEGGASVFRTEILEGAEKDRKSVEEGTSVEGRVDRGGRRYLKKKKRN